MTKNTQNQTHVESMWGSRILDEGFTNLPNLIIRNYQRVGLTHAEYCLINIILTFKHDTKDPYPSQETLAKIFYGDSFHKNSTRALRKLLKSIEDKGLMRVGYKYNKSGRETSVYNFELLIDAVLNLDDPKEEEEKEIKWKDNKKGIGTKSSGTTGTKSSGTTGTKSSGTRSPKVPTKKKREKENQKKKNEKENLSITQDEINNSGLNELIQNNLHKEIDRLIVHNISLLDILNVYEQYKTIATDAQFNSALSFALKKNKITNFDSLMSTNIKNKLKLDSEIKGVKKATRKEITPDWLEEQETNAPAKSSEGLDLETLEQIVEFFKEGMTNVDEDHLQQAVSIGLLTQEDIDNKKNFEM